MVRPRRRSALPWQPPSPAFAWSRPDVIQLHFQIMSIRTRASRWQGPGGPGGTGRQSWLTRCEGEAVDCTARRSSGSGTAHAAVRTTEAPSRTAATCADTRRLRLLSVTSFPSSPSLAGRVHSDRLTASHRQGPAAPAVLDLSAGLRDILGSRVYSLECPAEPSGLPEPRAGTRPH
jgi:hypothetical protein